MSEHELSPTPEDWEMVRQVEDYQPQTVPVDVTGIVATYELPAKRAVMRRFNVPFYADTNNAPPVELVPADPRIKNVWLQSSGTNPGDIYIGTYEQCMATQRGNGTTDAFQYVGSNPFGPLQGFDTPIYAYAQVTGSNIVSVRLEYWAD
jgi:hypothetical protein